MGIDIGPPCLIGWTALISPLLLGMLCLGCDGLSRRLGLQLHSSLLSPGLLAHCARGRGSSRGEGWRGGGASGRGCAGGAPGCISTRAALCSGCVDLIPWEGDQGDLPVWRPVESVPSGLEVQLGAEEDVGMVFLVLGEQPAALSCVLSIDESVRSSFIS